MPDGGSLSLPRVTDIQTADGAVPSSTSRAWTLHTDDGQVLQWRDRHVGPTVLAEADLNSLSMALLGLPVSAVEAAASRALLKATSGGVGGAVIIHSATPITRAYQRELSDVRRQRPPADTATQLETRAVYLAGPGDAAAGRTQPWLNTCQHAGVLPIDVGLAEYYYLSHALLVAARRHERGGHPSVRRLVSYVRHNPMALIRVYALDLELQIFLLWLKRAANVDHLLVDGNFHGISGDWSPKSNLYPVADSAASGEADGVLAPGGRAAPRPSRFATTLNLHLPTIPGYAVRRRHCQQTFVNDALLAAQRLRESHGVLSGCLKPARSGGGEWVTTNIDLADRELLERLAQGAFRNEDDFVLEAHVAYRRAHIGASSTPLAPSGHIAFGRVQDGLTLQLIAGTKWQGNVYMDADTCEELGVERAEYATMRRQLHALVDAFSAGRYGRTGISTAGIDFAIGSVQAHGPDLVAVLDTNIHSHGAECLRMFRARSVEGGHSGFVASQRFQPSPAASLAAIHDALGQASKELDNPAACLGLVPDRWGMIAAAGPDPLRAIGNVQRAAELLSSRGLAARR